jgi:hypothetical protein
LPELINYTPYPNFRYYSRDKDDRDFGIVIVKATYELAPSGRLERAEEQAPMVFTDLCHGAVNMTSLWHPSDLVPNKPATDIIVNATARTFEKMPKKAWKCGILVEDGDEVRVEKLLRVTGPRHWRPVWKRALSEREQANWKNHLPAFDRWELSEPEPVTEVLLRYENAFGGEIAQGPDKNGKTVLDTDERNPLGCGKIDPEWTDHTRPVRAPQIEAKDESINVPYQIYSPQSLNPSPPAWLPRRPLGGTYDQNWIDNVWPAWPSDYDFAYHNSAHADLIVKPYLRGHERVSLLGLAGWARIVTFDLPGEEVFTDFVMEDGAAERKRMNLDTVFLDIAAPSRRDWRVYLSWRVNFEPDLYEKAVIHSGPASKALASAAAEGELEPA